MSPSFRPCARCAPPLMNWLAGGEVTSQMKIPSGYTESLVYFMRPVGKLGPVKIGSTISPANRLQELGRHSPIPLEIAAIIYGPRSLECRFHAMFESLHSHGEWFVESEGLTRTIEQVALGVFDVNTLPNGTRIHLIEKRKHQNAK